MSLTVKSYYQSNNADYSRYTITQALVSMLVDGLIDPVGLTGKTLEAATSAANIQMFGDPAIYTSAMSALSPTYTTTTDGSPKAYMVWTLFDSEFNLVKSSSGMLRVPATANATQTLSQLNIQMDRGGYFYAYLVNESPMNVYFDNFQVVHTTGPVLEENHYYPFGMLNTQLAAQSISEPLNFYKYNGKELQKDLNLEWLDYGARFYDPQIGRWHSVDPRAEEDWDFSPYVYVADNPMSNVDPDGEFLFTVIGAVVGGAVAAVKGGDWKEIGKGALAGAVAGAVIDITIATGGTAGALIAAGAVSGMAGEATHQALDGNFNLKNLAVAGAVGLAFGMAAEAAPGIARTISGAMRKGTVDASGEMTSRVMDDAASTYAPKNGEGNLLKVEKTKAGNTKIDPEAQGTTHTQLRTDKSGNYSQRTTFDSKGRKRADTHYTTHNEQGKSSPHKHTYYKDGRRQK